METLSEYLSKYPEYAFDFSIDLLDQRRVYDLLTLAQLPPELEAPSPAEKVAGRGNAKRNQCKTHLQCIECDRLLRNDAFLSPPSFRAKNRGNSYCKECFTKRNASRYSNGKALIAARRDTVWKYLAPSCLACGQSFHPAAMDMHHIRDKTEHINILVTALTAVPAIRHAEKLIAEASKCIPLCSNCHRTFHSGGLALPMDAKPLKYSTWELLDRLAETEDSLAILAEQPSAAAEA